MRVREIMTPHPVCVDAGATLDEAVTAMEEGRIRHLVVLDGDRLHGVISDRDLLQATGWLPSRVREVFQPRSCETLVRDVAHSPPVTVDADTGLVTACLDLVGRKIGCMPVTAGGSSTDLIGMVSEMDVLSAFVRVCGGGPVDPPVEKKMVTGPVTGEPDTTLRQAAERMVSSDIRHLPIVENDMLVGMLTDRDVHRAAGQGRSEDTPVEEVMVRDVVSVQSTDLLSRSAFLMRQRRFSATPVVEDGRLVGMLTSNDVLEHCLGAFRHPSVVNMKGQKR